MSEYRVRTAPHLPDDIVAADSVSVEGEAIIFRNEVGSIKAIYPVRTTTVIYKGK